jgi:hypothetical protein
MKYKCDPLLWGLLLIMPAILFGCRKAYDPPAIKQFSSLLVVEGDIESGTDSTIIKISHTVKLSSQTTLNPEQNAQVAVESDQNTSYQLTEIKPGTYAIAGMTLDKSRQYRLDIRTAAGKQYVSDLMPVLDSPPIDSLHWDLNGSPLYGTGVNIYASTHDASNKVRYFRWDYAETWEFHSYTESYFKSNGDSVLTRDLVNDNIYQCWKSDTSSATLIASDAQLSQSVIINSPIAFVHSADEKVSVEYSILVKQHALTAAAYSFYSTLKKNTEQIGSIFDAQPSELKGNIHNADDPSEPVLGYVSVGGVSSTRIFINRRKLPDGNPAWTPVTYYTLNAACMLATDPENPKKSCCYFVSYDTYGNFLNQVHQYIDYNISHNGIPLTPVDAIVVHGVLLGYSAAIPECVDCTLRGTNKKPAFWQ